MITLSVKNVPINYKAYILESNGPWVAATTKVLYQHTAKNPIKIRIPKSFQKVFFLSITLINDVIIL